MLREVKVLAESVKILQEQQERINQVIDGSLTCLCDELLSLRNRVSALEERVETLES